jgi:hypothetical protein
LNNDLLMPIPFFSEEAIEIPSLLAAAGITYLEHGNSRAAKLLIDQHGSDAGLRAAERADQLLDAGDMIGAVT